MIFYLKYQKHKKQQDYGTQTHTKNFKLLDNLTIQS